MKTDAIEGHYRNLASRGLLDPDIATILIATRREGLAVAGRGGRLDDVRPRPLKHQGILPLKTAKAG